MAREQKPSTRPRISFQVGDEVMYAGAATIRYGAIVRVLGDGESQMIEIQFEDGKKEMKKSRDRSLKLLRRKMAGPSRVESHDREAEEVRRSEVRRK
jgi:hypothetical protein